MGVRCRRRCICSSAALFGVVVNWTVDRVTPVSHLRCDLARSFVEQWRELARGSRWTTWYRQVCRFCRFLSYKCNSRLPLREAATSPSLRGAATTERKSIEAYAPPGAMPMRAYPAIILPAFLPLRDRRRCVINRCFPAGFFYLLPGDAGADRLRLSVSCRFAR